MPTVTQGYDLADIFKSLHIVPQKPAPKPIPDDMKVIVQSLPALGQVTQAKDGRIVFAVLLEIPSSYRGEPWEVALWQSSDDGDWSETYLKPVSEDETPRDIQLTPDHLTRFFYTAVLSVQKCLQFTLRFRCVENEPWRWTRDELGMGDGIVLVNGAPASDLSEDISQIIKGLNPVWQAESALSQAPRTRLWSLSVQVAAAVGDDSTIDDIHIGVPWGQYLRWFALIRTWTPWLAPRQGKSHFDLDKDGVVCSFLSPQGKHLVLLALSGVNHTSAVFRSHNETGGVVLHTRNDGSSPEAATVLVAVGDSFESANAAVMYQARNVVQLAKSMTNEWQNEVEAIQSDIKPEWIENWYDGLGYCTWNGLGQRLTEQKIFDAVEKLAENKIKVTSLIIDDNWQSIDYKGHGQFQHAWREFEAEAKSFPNGLKATVSHIRENHPHIQHIAVWHALLGYWAGISPEGKLAKDYKTTEIFREDAERRNLPLGGKMTVIAKEDIDRFYDDFYKFLSSCGIDGVKTDAQFMMDTWLSASARRDLTKAYLDAWTISSLRHFSIKAISCMSQVPQIMFYSQLSQNRPPVLCRNSDDFFPHVPSSHPWHVWSNAHNTLLTQHLNTLPDWDMFQTVHDYSGFHAAARCVSGGPIYITDVPGQHNLDLIKQMTGLTTRGKTVIFRPSVLGKSIDAYNSYHDDALLKIGSYHGAAVTGIPILGIFNVSSRPLTEILPLSCFPGVLSSMKYVVRAHSTGLVTAPVAPGTPDSNVVASLGIRGHDIFTAYPLSAFDSEARGKVFAANLGLLGKMTGAAAIVSSDFELERDGKVVLKARLKALGIFGIYLSKLPELTIKDDFLAIIQGRVIPVHTVSVSSDDRHVLEIDVEKAWEEMGLQPGWSNEVEIKVYFSIDHHTD